MLDSADLDCANATPTSRGEGGGKICDKEKKMEGDRGKCQKEDQERSQRDEEMATDHIKSLGQRRGWDERFSIAPPCGLRVGGYRIEWAYEMGIHSGFGDLFGGVCLRAVGYA